MSEQVSNAEWVQRALLSVEASRYAEADAGIDGSSVACVGGHEKLPAGGHETAH
jgi:hypothetical protein